MFDRIKEADDIRKEAEFEEERATAILVKLLTGKSFWERQMEKAHG